MHKAETSSSEGLKRVIGVTGLSLTVVNSTIGAGIFALPALIGIQLGAFGLVAYLFCSVMLAAIVLCYAEIGSKVTTSGGSYAYVEAAFGDMAGFVTNWLYFFGWGVLGSAAIINILADALAVLLPIFSEYAFRVLLFFVLISVVVFINIRGAKQTIRFLEIVTVVKLLPLVLLVIFGIFQVKGSNLQFDSIPTVKTFANSALVLFFAFAGFEASLNVSGEIKNPKKTIPRGIFIGGLILLVIYILLQVVTQGILGAEIANYKDAPLAAVAEKLIGPIGATMLLIATVISCFGIISGDIMATPRLLFAGANDGLFPKFLAKVHPRFATPHLAIICYGAMIFLFAISGGFKQLAVLASCAILLIYLLVILATIKLRYVKQAQDQNSFKVPGGHLIPIIGIASILWLLTSLTKYEVTSTIVFIGVICVVYFIMKYFKKGKIA